MKRLKKDRPRGVILYRGKSLIDGLPVVVVATFESKNDKTGDMVQVWILPDHTQGIDPVQALSRPEINRRICGDCPLQGTIDPNTGQNVGRACYVNVGQAPLAVWRGVQAGIYPTYQTREHRCWFIGRKIRNGAYGDPAAFPVKITRWLAKVGSGHTGYTHQIWTMTHHPRRQAALAEFLMISCHTRKQAERAAENGWRFFQAITPGEDPAADALECPHYTHGIECEQCLLCCGTSKGARSIFARAHGKGAGHLHQIQLQEAAR